MKEIQEFHCVICEGKLRLQKNLWVCDKCEMVDMELTEKTIGESLKPGRDLGRYIACISHKAETVGYYIDIRVTAGDKVSDKDKEYLDFFRKFNSVKIGIDFYQEKNDCGMRTMGRELYSLLKLMDSDVSKEIMALKVESYSSDGAV